MAYRSVYNNYSGTVIKIGGTARTASAENIKIDSTLRNTKEKYIKIGGVWKQISCYSNCTCDQEYYCSCDCDDDCCDYDCGCDNDCSECGDKCDECHGDCDNTGPGV